MFFPKDNVLYSTTVTLEPYKQYKCTQREHPARNGLPVSFSLLNALNLNVNVQYLSTTSPILTSNM